MRILPVTQNLQFPEGPIALGDGSIVLVEMRRQTLTRVFPSGEQQIIAHIKGGPNGAAIGPDGAIYICNNGHRYSWIERAGQVLPGPKSAQYSGGSIDRVELVTGRVETVLSGTPDAPLIAPNDLVFDSIGGIWFTDHGGYEEDGLLYGTLYYVKPDLSRAAPVRRRLLTPNGVGLSPDGRTVYVAETVTGKLWAIPLDAPGVTSREGNRRAHVLATLTDNRQFDSLAVEADGHVCVATIGYGGISVVDEAGHIDHQPFPDSMITNIAFGGEDMRDAWITGSGTGTLYRCRWPRPGLRLHFAH